MISKKVFDNNDETSLATRLRRKRFTLFFSMLDIFQKPVCILDVGGSEQYWKMMGASSWGNDFIKVTLLNIEPQAITLPGFDSVIGDGRNMEQFSDRQFDIVHSNSTIEHVGDFEDQKRMANEIRRVGKAYYVQTPNRYFPIEPHFMFPFFQFLPVWLRIWLVMNFSLGWFNKIRDKNLAKKEVVSIRLMDKQEIRILFPDAMNYDEKIFGIIKSIISYKF